MEIDGEKHAESLSIARYIANEVQLAGNNNLENMKIDSIVNALEDFSTSTYMKNAISISFLFKVLPAYLSIGIFQLELLMKFDLIGNTW